MTEEEELCIRKPVLHINKGDWFLGIFTVLSDLIHQRTISHSAEIFHISQENVFLPFVLWFSLYKYLYSGTFDMSSATLVFVRLVSFISLSHTSGLSGAVFSFPVENPTRTQRSQGCEGNSKEDDICLNCSGKALRMRRNPLMKRLAENLVMRNVLLELDLLCQPVHSCLP